ncbi:MAG: hypothetical protein KBF93_00340 [Leptospiraceae bacterium]|nr:hypothetical protein [Leptospiraceae bacterium]
MYTNKLNIFVLLFFIVANSIFAEKVVTTKDDLPDAYFGLKVGAVVSPSFGYRLRDSSSGISNAKKDDRTGFSMPWTLFMVSKEWEDKKITVEFWGEILRSSVITSDTTADNANKANAYLLGIRRASVKKNIEYGMFNFSFIFGIHELPHVYTQWNGYWKWRYVDRSPMESLGFSPQAADLGASFLMQVKSFNLHVGIVNGEGYRDLQNSTSSGYDAVSRFSFEPQLNKLKMGFHLLGRAGNVMGVAGDECKEGKTSCLPSDNNVLTRRERELRAQYSESMGGEFTLLFDKYINLGVGVLWKKQYRGKIFDRLNPNLLPTYESDLKDRAFYGWLGFGYSDFQIVFRGETGRGVNGVFTPTVNADKSRFTRKSIFIEYMYSDTVRFSIGGIELIQFDREGLRRKDYVDMNGESSNKTSYDNQFYTGINQGIVSYSNRDRQLFIKSTIDF